MRRNKMRELLREGKPTIGTHVLISWPSIVEIIGQTGVFDYVEFQSTYAPYDLYAIENFARAVELFDMSSVMKVDQEPRGYLATRAIGSGIQNILFADIRSVADAEHCVQVVRPDTPESKGTNGAGLRRDVGYNITLSGSPEYVHSLNEVVVILMIEKPGAVDHLEEILAVKGVDMINPGPNDYAMSIGLAGQWQHPKVKEAERKVIETALKMGIPPRVSILSLDQVKYYSDLGVRHFCLSYDVVILFEWLKKNGEDLKKLVSSL